LGEVAVHELERISAVDHGLDSCFRSISDRGLGDAGGEAVAAWLGGSGSSGGEELWEVGLHYNRLGDRAARALGHALRHTWCRNIRELSLYSNRIGILTLLSRCFHAAFTLFSRFVHAVLGPAGGLALAEGLRGSPTLEVLDLGTVNPNPTAL